MFKKDLGLLILILVVGTAVALINQRFLLAGNVSNTANQVGLFGLFSIGEALVIIAAGCLVGVAHGLLITKMHLQPFVVTLCGLLIYRGVARYYTQDATAGFGFGASFPTLEWLTAGRSNVLGFPLPHSVVALI